jgi:cyclomaltodextrinase / maltogenic alpha-amylase / neopullulanase
MIDSWKVPEWTSRAIFYQLFPDRFYNGNPDNDPPDTVPWDSTPTRDNFLGGDLEGIRSKLDYLQNLGVTALYTTPFFKAGTNHRYDAHDYLQIDPAMGTMDDFHDLVQGLKTHNMRLIMDAVFNHCGEGFWAFEDVRKHGAASAYAGWFIVDHYPITSTPPSYQTCGGTPLLPKLNTQNPEVCEYLLKVTRYWLDQGADGWRLDVPWKTPIDFWQKFRQEALNANPDAYLVAEVWRGTEPWLHGDTVHGVMNYRLRNHILDYCALDHMDAEDFDYELAELRHEHADTAPYHLTLLGSHDTPRILTMCGGDEGRAIISIVFQMTYIGIPMIYYGDEVGMAGDNDPLCRGGMVWEQSQHNRRIYDTYYKLIHLRNQNPALTEGSFETLRVFNGVYAYRRFTADTSVIVVMNPRETRYNVSIPLGGTRGVDNVWQDVLTDDTFLAQQGQIVLDTLPSCSARVLIRVEEK